MTEKNRPLFVYGLLLLVSLPLFFGLGSVGFFEPEESRYAEMGREMLESGDWIVPRLGGLPYLEKPPLTVWVTASSFAVFGESEWSGRFVSLFSAGLLLLFTTRIAKRIGGPQVGIYTGVVLLANPLFFAMARILSTDTLFAALIVGAVDFLWSARREPHRLNLFGLGVCAAGSLLCKGPLSLILIVLAAASLSWCDRTWRPLKLMLHPISMVTFILLGVPWFLWMMRLYPSFFDFYFIQHNVARFLPLRPEDKAIHSAPFWYYFPVLLLGFFPWVFLLPTALRNAWKGSRDTLDRPALRALLFWAALGIVFFSAATGKRIPYLLPIWPVLALGIAIFLQSQPEAKTILWAWLPFPLLAIAGFFFKDRLTSLEYEFNLGGDASTLLGLFAAGALATFVLSIEGWTRAMFVVTLAWLVLLESFSILLLSEVESHLSVKPTAQTAAANRSAQTIAVCYPQFFPGFSYYGFSDLRVLGSPHELDYGMTLEKRTPPLLISESELASIIEQRLPVLLLGSQRRIDRGFPFSRNFISLPTTGRWTALRTVSINEKK